MVHDAEKYCATRDGKVGIISKISSASKILCIILKNGALEYQ